MDNKDANQVELQKALDAEANLRDCLHKESPEGSRLRAGLCLRKIDYTLQRQHKEKGMLGIFAVHVVLDSSIVRGDNHSRTMRQYGLKYRSGPGWQPLEDGGWQGQVGYFTLINLSRLDGIHRIYHLIG